MTSRPTSLGLAISAVLIAAALLGAGWAWQVPGLLRFGIAAAAAAVLLCAWAWFVRRQGWE